MAPARVSMIHSLNASAFLGVRRKGFLLRKHTSVFEDPKRSLPFLVELSVLAGSQTIHFIIFASWKKSIGNSTWIFFFLMLFVGGRDSLEPHHRHQSWFLLATVTTSHLP